MSVFDDFKTHGMNASYHYADDTASGEWRLGSIEEAKALKIFDANPDDQEKMREIAKGFLWSLNSKRPKATLTVGRSGRKYWDEPEEADIEEMPKGEWDELVEFKKAERAKIGFP